MAIGQKITPFLWFDNNAEEAVGFYTSIFKDSRTVTRSRCGDSGPGPKGSILAIAFKLEGQDFVALNGGPHFKFTEAISLYDEQQPPGSRRQGHAGHAQDEEDRHPAAEGRLRGPLGSAPRDRLSIHCR